MHNTPQLYPTGMNTSLHLQFLSEISPSVSFPPRQSSTQATRPGTQSSGEASFWKARGICMCQGKTVNSVHLPSRIWKPPPLFIKQQSPASLVTPRLQAPASRIPTSPLSLAYWALSDYIPHVLLWAEFSSLCTCLRSWLQRHPLRVEHAVESPLFPIQRRTAGLAPGLAPSKYLLNK